MEEGVSEGYAINISGTDSIVLKLEKGAYVYEIFGLYGEKIGETQTATDVLIDVDVPYGGMVKVKKFNR